MTKIRYLSLFSGIEAFSCAVKDMPEFEPVAFAEIEPFPCAVLAHHYPNVKNLGDVTKIDGRKYRGLVDLIVGGSPCQGFSVAGLREGLGDPRSALALTYVRLVKEIQPKWLLWENVPGILSCNHGQDFRSFLSALDDLNYSLAGTVLDSQWFGVPQRRRRMFVVGCAGADWESCTKIFFEPKSMCRNPPARRKAGEGDSAGAEDGARNSGVSGTLCASGAGLDRPSAQGNQLDYLVQDVKPEQAFDVCGTLPANGAGLDRSGTASMFGFSVIDVSKPKDVIPIDYKSYHLDEGGRGSGIGNAGDPAYVLRGDRPPVVGIVERERERERVEQPLETAGTMTASATGLDRPGRNSADFLILDSASRERERERVVCDETAGALLSRDGKGMSSTIDGKLVAVETSSER